MVLVIRKSVNDVTQRPVLMPVYGEKGDLIGKSDTKIFYWITRDGQIGSTNTFTKIT